MIRRSDRCDFASENFALRDGVALALFVVCIVAYEVVATGRIDLAIGGVSGLPVLHVVPPSFQRRYFSSHCEDVHGSDCAYLWKEAACRQLRSRTLLSRLCMEPAAAPRGRHNMDISRGTRCGCQKMEALTG